MVISLSTDSTIPLPIFLLPIDFNIVLDKFFFGPEVLLYPIPQVDLKSRRRESSDLIIPLSKLEKKGLRYGTHAVIMLSA